MNIRARMLVSLQAMVGAAGLEPAASCTQNKRATRLRHAPTLDVPLFASGPSRKKRDSQASASFCKKKQKLLIF
jgi:hypothetical protein